MPIKLRALVKNLSTAHKTGVSDVSAVDNDRATSSEIRLSSRPSFRLRRASRLRTLILPPATPRFLPRLTAKRPGGSYAAVPSVPRLLMRDLPPFVGAFERSPPPAFPFGMTALLFHGTTRRAPAIGSAICRIIDPSLRLTGQSWYSSQLRNCAINLGTMVGGRRYSVEEKQRH